MLAVLVYVRCSDQWRYSEGGGAMVIDNTNIAVVMKEMAIAKETRLDVFDDVKLIIGEIADAVGRERQKKTEQAKDRGKHGAA